ncbi:beta-lactamase family protein [Xanthomonas sp. AM6]|uniref:serine hydrolase domain-containing protein n=1 Tax=Xanthomonas sp. AM6 TaxID=2982531 RepID=UPI0021D7E52A|nr:serine hydrolase domain-containing protein [Xanthomonas sp. AM6]UYB52855.1 beta-lactamase family protein [Xanthomonas sp. AM6]
MCGWLFAACAMAPAFAAAAPDTAAAPPRAELDRLFEQALSRYRPPGLAVGVIENGEMVYARSAGELRAGSGERIDGQTLFKIASNSKAMTTALLARLVDAGKLRWDDPVTRHLPEFRMYDPWVTRNIQVRDLLIHNSGLGLGAGDLMLWPEPNDFTRADIVAGLAHLKPTHSFRSHYAYDNLLYVVAGEVAARAGGKPYAQLLQEQVFAPLGMRRCQVGAWERDAVGNVAQPHMRQGEANIVVRADAARIPDSPSMAAGGVRCSLDDMLAWMRAWLAPAGDTAAWLSPAQRQALWTLHTPMPVSAQMREWDGTRLYGYGYGWRLADVDGQWQVAHTGTLMGMYSALVLLPDRRSGFVILSNGEGAAMRTALGEALLKRFTRPGQPALDVAHYAALLERARAQAGARARAGAGTSARVPVAATVARDRQGVWRDPWFGEVALCPQQGMLRWQARKSPLLRGRVMRTGARWLVDWDAASVDAEPWLDFVAGTDGTPRMRLAHVDPDADFSYDYADLDFVRVGPCPDLAEETPVPTLRR